MERATDKFDVFGRIHNYTLVDVDYIEGLGVSRDMFKDGLLKPFFVILEWHGRVDVQFVPSSL
jgi:hypothetical protein